MKIVPRVLLPFIYFSLFTHSRAASSQNISFAKQQTIIYSVDSDIYPVIQTALQLFEHDLSTVLEATLQKGNKRNAHLYIPTLSPNEKDPITNHHEAFRIKVKNDILHITGSDANGTAYGIMELSGMLGVSPWEWWADSHLPK